jgi:2-keto-3-deoxy-L-rhamnonate aldolase RhmA
MRTRWINTFATFALLGLPSLAQSQHLNPTIDLLAQKKPVFGLYAPSNPRAGRGAAPVDPAMQKSQAQLALDALGNKSIDFIFNGNMEGGDQFDGQLASFAEFVKGMQEGGVLQKSSSHRLTHPLSVKTPEIAPNPAVAAERIAKQLNVGTSIIVFVGVESAKEVEQGLAAMRFKSKGGTRPDDVGSAPAFWGMSEKDYREKADLWPLNPKGELVNWTIVESKEGLAHVREIAAVQGIGVLFPGAGTLGGVFSTTDSTGRRVRDTAAWEAAIQQVLSACKEFKVACGYPANDSAQIELRMKQGFTVFISGWNENGFKAVEHGRKLSGRDSAKPRAGFNPQTP